MILKKPLSDLDQLHASKELKQHTLEAVMAKRKQHHSWYYGLAFVLTCVLCMVFYQTSQTNSEPVVEPAPQVYAYVTFDINPSLEFYLDENNQIIDTKAYNKDGEALLAQLSLKNESLTESISQLLSNTLFQSYMKDGYLQVSVYSEDETHSLALETMLDETIGEHYDDDQYGCTCASKHDQEQANNHHMSFGRYQMIEMILRADESYQVDDLQDLPMKELKELYEKLSGASGEETQRNTHHGRNHH